MEDLVFDVEGTQATAIPSVRVVQDAIVPDLGELEGAIDVLAQLVIEGDEDLLLRTLESVALEYLEREDRSLQSVS